LRDTVHFAHQGDVRHRQLADQAAQALCFSLVVNSVAAFKAGLLGQAVDRLRGAGFDIADEDIAHLGPTMTEHINVNGRYYFDVTARPKAFDPHHSRRATWRTKGSPLRSRWFLFGQCCYPTYR
jgi:hypothetical protein